MEEYLIGIRLTDRESYNLLFQEFPDHAEEIEEAVKGFLSVSSTIDGACELTRSAIYLSSAGE